MLFNYLLLSYRNMVKNITFSAVNILTLAVAISVALMILNYVAFESSYDTMHAKRDRLYRVESQFYEGDILTDDWATSSYGYGSAMQREIAEIEQVVRFDVYNTEQIVRYGDKKYRETGITYSEPSMFTAMSFTLSKGDPLTALSAPNQVVISPWAAEKYFAGEDPMGKTLRFNSLDGEIFCEVTGILEQIPLNSSIKFDFYISWETHPKWLKEFWYRHEVYTYALLREGADPSKVESAFRVMSEKYKTEEALRNKTWAVVLNPLSEVYLSPWKQYERDIIKGNTTVINSLVLIAFAILVIAWINYINLTTARSLERAKEVGIRKVSGALRSNLISQFMLDSLLTNILALLAALAIISFVQPLFLSIVGKEISMVILGLPLFWITLISVFVLGVVLSGFYPAFIISSVRPLQVLKGKYIHSHGAGTVRKSLVVLQFVASLVLISGTFAVHSQVKFMRNQPLGVDIANVFAIKFPAHSDDIEQKLESFKRELKGIKSIEQVTFSNSIPGIEVAYYLSNRRASDATKQNRLYEMLNADYDYMACYGLPVVAGRSFSEEFTGDENRLIINMSALRALGYSTPMEALGDKVLLETRDVPVEIVGVVEDYHQQGLNRGYTPIMFLRESCIEWLPLKFISVRFTDGVDAGDVMERAEQVWQRFFPESTYDSFVVDQFYGRQYDEDSRFGTIFAIFSGIALSISIVGLWMLTLFSLSTRRKEMGVRKVFGASGWDMFVEMSREFSILILISIAVGVPLSWFVCESYLQGYAFRVSMQWLMFLLPIVIVISVTLFTIGGQIAIALRSNPIRSLKSE